MSAADAPTGPSAADRSPTGAARRRGPSRRALLLGGLALAAGGTTGVGLVEQDVLPGRVRLHALLGLNGPDGSVPDILPGPVQRGSFTSAARRGARTGWVIAHPPPGGAGAAGRRLPVCVVLHGHGEDETGLLTLGLDRFLAAATRAGVPPFALAAVSGGNGYWHRRGTGDDAGRLVTDEFLPMLAARGLAARPRDRVAFLGWSMGGYGALLLGERLGPGRVAAIGALSPALWRAPGETVRGAFDDPADFHRHDVFADRAALAGIRIRIDCGRGDPFLPADRAFAAGLHPAPAGGFPPGGHDGGFWRRVVPAHLTLIGAALTPTGR